jgi:hypothetical protein
MRESEYNFQTLYPLKGKQTKTFISACVQIEIVHIENPEA